MAPAVGPRDLTMNSSDSVRVRERNQATTVLGGGLDINRWRRLCVGVLGKFCRLELTKEKPRPNRA
jgi:hypothetical protein